MVGEGRGLDGSGWDMNPLISKCVVDGLDITTHLNSSMTDRCKFNAKLLDYSARLDSIPIVMCD
jgi:hypothetical protein